MLQGLSDEVKAQRRQTSSTGPLSAAGAAGPVTTVPADLPSTAQVQLGVISTAAPTVSHLLKAHPSLGQETWNILSSSVNRGKDFTRIPVGTVVQVDPSNHEITWRRQGQNDAAVTAATDRVETVTPVTTSPVASPTPAENRPSPSAGSTPVLIGTIDGTNSTVSHLLKKNPQFADQTWELLSSTVNRDKPYHQIAKGTEIYLQPGTGEITWDTAKTVSPVFHETVSSVPVNRNAQQKKQQSNTAAANLSEAVQPFLGKSYSEINCYELVVNGLRRMDIQYGGKGGLYSKLTNMARESGLAANAYLTGEGIVKAAGSQVLTKNYSTVSNWKEEAEALFKEMEPLLDKGQILSFSAGAKGHTGIVSQQGDQWTYINSGRLDNSVAATNRRQGVGEEVLHKEIRNWFKLAHSNRDNLTVTLGRLEQGKIRTAANLPEPFSIRS
jgi:hypothetical protein